MKTKILILILCSLTIILGCKKKITTIGPDAKYVEFLADANTAKAYVMAMLPQINTMYNQTQEITMQNIWLRENLDKCLKMLEAEKGLKPIYRKYHDFIGSDPNFLTKYSEANEPKKPWFASYEGLARRNFENELDDIAVFRGVLCSGLSAVETHIFYNNDWIKNFEERLKRIDPNQPMQK